MASLTALASKISIESEKLAHYIQKHDLPEPSFAVNGPAQFPIPAEKLELNDARLALLRAAEDIAALALGPVETLRWQAWNQYNTNITLHFLLRYSIPTHVVGPTPSEPSPAPTSFTTLAELTSLPFPLLTRILRHAILHHIFTEPVVDSVAHTAMSLSLAKNSSHIHDWLSMTLEEWGPAAVYAVDAYEKWGGAENGQQSEDQGETGIGMALGDPGGRGRTIFGYLGEKDATGRDGKREERTRVFGSAIGNFSKGDSHRVEYLVKGYDWKALGKGKGKVVDIGGSHGHISMAIADFAPHLTFVVQDLRYTAADGEKLLPEKYKDTIHFQEYDMNNVQPVKGASLYLFRSVLLNWPDAYVVKFLSNLIPALTSGCRILINEGVLPSRSRSAIASSNSHPDSHPTSTPQPSKGTDPTGDGNVNGKEMSFWDERLLRNLDLCMMAMFNSKERTVEEWAGLFRKASEGFKFLGAKNVGGLLWIIEAEWVGGEEGKREGDR